MSREVWELERKGRFGKAVRGAVGGLLRARQDHLLRQADRRARYADSVHATVTKLERMRSFPQRKLRMMATAALSGGGGGHEKLRRADRQWRSSVRKATANQRHLERHFGGY